MKITDIKVIDRRRRANEDTVKSLADSLSSVGLINPITVNKEGRLLAGLHRLEAAKLLGWLHIPATVLDLDDLGSRLAEIDENLIREDLSVLERGEWLQERKTIYEEMFPETRKGVAGGKARQGSANAESAFAENTSNLTGKSLRSVETSVRRAANIPQDVRDDIRDIESIADSGVELDALASMPEEEQREAVALVKSGQAKNIRKAQDKVKRKPESVWSQRELSLKKELEQGKSVVLNLSTDHNLVHWADDRGIYVRADRRTKYGNPFIMGEDGDRDYVCDCYEEHYLPHKNLNFAELRGKALGCWCAPLRCHCESLARRAENALAD